MRGAQGDERMICMAMIVAGIACFALAVFVIDWYSEGTVEYRELERRERIREERERLLLEERERALREARCARMRKDTTVVLGDGRRCELSQLFSDDPSADWHWERLEDVARCWRFGDYSKYCRSAIDEYELMDRLGGDGMREVLMDYEAQFVNH